MIAGVWFFVGLALGAMLATARAALRERGARQEARRSHARFRHR